jgi:MFS transporter, DHA2 family, multidrug resistance protein
MNEMAGDAPVPQRATGREWIGLAVLTLAALVYAMDLTVLNLAVPALSADLKPSASELLWIIDIYGFFVAGSLITMGTLGDRIGRRRLLMIGAAAFGAASVVAAFSRTAEMLIFARAILGLAGATLAPSTLSLIRNMFHDRGQRTFAISIWIMSYSVGGAIGPLLGGLVLQRFPWGGVFLLSVPVMILLLVAGPRLLPEFRDPNAGRLDLRSAALSLSSVLLIIYGVKRSAEHGFGWVPAATFLAGLLIGAIFLARQRRIPDPFVELRLFRSAAFSAALSTNVFGVFVAFGAYIFIAQYLQLVLGLSPLEAGLWTLPWSAGNILGSFLTPILVRRWAPATVMAGGLVLAAAGFAVLTLVDGPSPLAVIVVSSSIFSLGLAPVFTLTTDTVVSAAPPERAGSAAALSETGAELGGAMGIALLGSVGTAIYRGTMLRAMPAGVPAEVAEAAGGTLGGAVAASEGLPEAVRTALLAVGREAFLLGFERAAIICAAVATTLAVLVLVLLRNAHARPAGAPARRGRKRPTERPTPGPS